MHLEGFEDIVLLLGEAEHFVALINEVAPDGRTELKSLAQEAAEGKDDVLDGGLGTGRVRFIEVPDIV